MVLESARAPAERDSASRCADDGLLFMTQSLMHEINKRSCFCRQITPIGIQGEQLQGGRRLFKFNFD